MLHRAQMGVSGGGKYIKFADPEVERVLLANGVSSDGVGITLADAEAVTSIGTWFKGNTEITRFDEFGVFVNAQNLPDYAFINTTSLKSVDLSNTARIGRGTFQGSAVEECVAPQLQTIGADAFRSCAIKRVLSLGEIVSMEVSAGYSYAFYTNTLELCILPRTIENIPTRAFAYTRGLVNVICHATTPPEIASDTFVGCSALIAIYVPDSSVDNYKAATNWVSLASKIKGISSLQTDNPTLYNEIKDYL